MRRISCALLIAAVGGCGGETQVTQPGTPLTHRTPRARYEIVKLPSLGGAVSRGSSINNRGWVAGLSTLPDGNRNAALWRNGSVKELGTLGGPHSSVQWPGMNDRGMIVGISQTAEKDTLGERWSCAAFLPSSGNVCLGFVWEDGVMKALPTLGGTNGFATSVNNRGQVVGWAENTVRDPTCNAPQVLQFRAVVWEPKKNTMRELRPYRGDSASAATAINERGQVVGISGDCDVAVGRFSARHAVLWEKGRVSKIGTLGGEYWHTPMDINERGDVVGFSNPPGVGGGDLLPHAFFWNKKDGIRDLRTLRGDDNSQALGINDRRQVVGVSCKGDFCRGFLWEDGVMKDFQTLVGRHFPDSIVAARHINDAGKITGSLVERSTGRTLTFVAIPKRGHR